MMGRNVIIENGNNKLLKATTCDAVQLVSTNCATVKQTYSKDNGVYTFLFLSYAIKMYKNRQDPAQVEHSRSVMVCHLYCRRGRLKLQDWTLTDSHRTLTDLVESLLSRTTLDVVGVVVVDWVSLSSLLLSVSSAVCNVFAWAPVEWLTVRRNWILLCEPLSNFDTMIRVSFKIRRLF